MNLNGFDLNLLRVLDALLRDGSTVAAASRIGLSQPAVSAALGRLRLSLGDQLFIRRGQGLEPTEFARSLAVPLREALHNLELLLAGPPAFDPGTAEGSFKISGSDFFAEMLMPTLAHEISRRAPGLTVQLVDLVPVNYIQTLDKRAVDLALIPETDFPEWAESQRLFRSSFAVVARPAHARLARACVAPGDVIPIDLFCDMGHVLFSPEGRLKAMGDAALARVGRERRVVMTLPVFSGVCSAIAESDLIGLVPRQLANRMAAAGRLEIYEAPMPIGAAQIVMVWKKHVTAVPAHRWLRDLVAEILAPMDEAPAA